MGTGQAALRRLGHQRRHGIVDTTPEWIRITRQRLAGFPSVSG
jgi:hypothetical protein